MDTSIGIETSRADSAAWQIHHLCEGLTVLRELGVEEDTQEKIVEEVRANVDWMRDARLKREQIEEFQMETARR